MRTDWTNIESVEVAHDYATEAKEIAGSEQEIRAQLKEIRDCILNGNTNAARRLHCHALHLLSLFEFVIDNTSALEQLTDLQFKAEKLLSAADKAA